MDWGLCFNGAKCWFGCIKCKTSAVLNEEGTAWKLNGEKQWITNAHMADVYVVLRRQIKE